ncbi:MAG: glycoside hydrolase family 9 protein, partial [Acidobacteriota bacterium]
RRGTRTAGATILLTERKDQTTGLGSATALAASRVSETIFVGSGGSIRVFDGSGTRNITSFDNDTVLDLVVFSSIDGTEFIAASLGSGKLVRVNPVTGQSNDLVSGLVDVTSLDVDPFSGDLLVGERTWIGLVSRMTLNKGLSGISQGQPGREIRYSSVQASDLATDRCTGDIYLAESSTGSVKKIDSRKQRRSVALENLSNPTRILSIYRKGTPCPSAFELLVFEQGTRTLSIWSPLLGTRSPVATNFNLAAMAFPGYPALESSPSGVWVSDSEGKLSSLGIGSAFDWKPINPSTMESIPETPLIRSISAVAPNILAIEIDERGVTEASQIPYVAQAGDQVEETGNHGYGTVWLRRNGKIIGALVGKDRDLLYTFDQFQGRQVDPAKVDRRELYWLTSPDDSSLGSGKHPTSLGRKSKPLEMVQTDTWRFLWPLRHTIYLRLPQDLREGALYRVHSDALPVRTVEYRHLPSQNRSEALHISHLGFRPDDPAKLGFLSCWMGDAGGLSYAPEARFTLFNEQEQIVLEGQTALAKAGNDKTEDPYNRNYNRADVHLLDFSALTQQGLYRACIEGIGCTYPFPVSTESWKRAFSTSAQGLYHQRSGIELSPSYTTYNRRRPFHPDDGMVILHSTAPLMDTGNGLNSSDEGNFGNLVAGMTDTPVPDAWGGYFDAGDWDRRIQHLDATRLLLELADLFPEFVGATQLEIPESGDGLPDILNEAAWGLDVFRRMQASAGGIRGGIESAEHPRRGEASWQESLPVMAYAPGVWSSYVYAGVAARAAHVLESFDPPLAETYSESALRAMEWAETEYPRLSQDYPHAVEDSRNLAAAELYRLTGLDRWHQIFLKTTAFTNGNNNLAVWQQHEQRDAAFVYLRTDHPGVNQAVWGNAYNALMREAQGSVSQARKIGFRWTKMDAWEPVGWGKLSTPAATNLLRAHFLSGKESYLTTAILACQTGSGANPVNISYTTWTGYDTPQHPLIVDQKVTAQTVPPGITIYGPFDLERPENSGYFTMQLIRDVLHPRMEDWPTIEAYFDLYLFPAVTEFTVMQNLAPTLYAWGYLAAREQEAN